MAPIFLTLSRRFVLENLNLSQYPYHRCHSRSCVVVMVGNHSIAGLEPVSHQHQAIRQPTHQGNQIYTYYLCYLGH